MATGDNFKKILAATVLKANGTDKFKLADKQLPTILSIITDMSFIGAYGATLEIGEISSGSITYTKNVAGVLADKPAGQIGSGTITATKFGSATIQFEENKLINEGIAAWDLARGIEGATAKKLAKFLDQIKKDWERKAYAKIKAAPSTASGQVNEVKVSRANLTPDKIRVIRAQFIKAATELTKIKDDKQGLDLISKDRVIIDIEPLLFDEMVNAAVIGDLATQAYTEGRFSMGTMGGYTVRSNFYLEDTSVDGNLCGVVSTDFAFGAPLKIVHALVERVNLSSDMAIAVESGYGSGFVYDKVMTKMIAAA